MLKMSKWQVKRRLFNTLLLDCDNKPVNSITYHRGKYLIKGIINNSSSSICRVKADLLSVEGTYEGQAKIRLGNDNFPFPARALSADITINEESYCLEQLPNRDFRILNAGRIQGYFTRTWKRTVNAEALDAWGSEKIALFYVISDIMLHEDDLYA